MTESTPWLLVGLGNPGAQYAKHRHNVGFMVVERFVERFDAHASWRAKWDARTVTISGPFGRCIVLQPQTYMNRSGRSVVAAAQFHHVPPAQVIVVHDELDFAFGRMAIKRGGGAGGHNGLRDIIAVSAASDFVRIRVGIGRPEHGDVSNWVLTDFPASDSAELPEIINHAVDAAASVMLDGLQTAMNKFNTSS